MLSDPKNPIHPGWRRPPRPLILAAAVLILAFAPPAPAAPPGGRAVKNIILMVGDGMGYNQVYATDMYDTGTTGSQVFEKFGIQYSMSTYPLVSGYDPAQAWGNFYYVTGNYTDSSAAATAMSTGRKTYNNAVGMIGVSDVVAVRGKHTVEYAEERGMATGVVTTNAITDATPAGFAAHNVSRYNNAELAVEMLSASGLDVLMGAGHPAYDDNNQPAAGRFYNYVGGQPTWDGLVAGTLAVADADHNGLADDAWTLIESKAQFEALATNPAPPKRLCGIARVASTLQWYRWDARGWGGDYKEDPPGAVPFNTDVPTLATMARGALNVLGRHPGGFFLVVEGGAIDWAGHNSTKGRLIEEAMDFNRAVEAVVNWVDTHSNWQETMLIVTADHETGHLWGAGSNPAFAPLVNNGPGRLPGMQFNGTSHTNTLVPFYAKGSAAVENIFSEAANQLDPRRGRYLDNAELGRIFIGLLEGALVPIVLSRFSAE